MAIQERKEKQKTTGALDEEDKPLDSKEQLALMEAFKNNHNFAWPRSWVGADRR